MNGRLILNLSGKVLLIEALMLAAMMLIALILGSGDAIPFLMTAALTGASGFLLRRVRTRTDTLRARDGFAAVALIWVLVSCFGALPFFLSRQIPNYLDALFESVSGFTTTGATILTDVERMSRGLLFWRSFTHWAGGMGVLVLSIAIMPRMGSRSIHLLRAESPGPSTEKLVPKIGDNARILYRLYLGLTVIAVIVYLICGMNLYDAAAHAFGTAGTGGFSVYNDSIAHYESPLTQTMVALFCMLFGVNFAMYWALLRKDFRTLWKSEELRLYLLIVAGASLLIAVSVHLTGVSFGTALKDAYFQVCSIITTTGFATADFNLWPQVAKIVLVFLMLIGCCAGSTGGGLKLIRVLLLGKVMRRDVRRTVDYRRVEIIKMDGRTVPEETVSGCLGFFFAYACVMAVSILLVSLESFFRDVSFETCVTGVVATISNIGPGLGEVGPTGNFAAFTPLSKIIFTLDMIIGRLELFPILMLVSRRAWKD